MSNKKIAIIDCDSLCYRVSAVSEERSILVTHTPSNKSKVFKNRTEFRNVLKDKDRSDKEYEYYIEDVQTPEDVSHALSTLKRSVSNIRDFLMPDKIEFYVGKNPVFRSELPLPHPYKGTRVNMLKPIHLDACREYLCNVKGASVITGIETDDYISIRGYEELKYGNIPIIGTADKDNYQCSGLNIFDYGKEDWSVLSIPEVGELHKSNNSYRGTGLKFLAYQMLYGDTGDCYYPYKLSKERFNTKYGSQKAYSAIADCNTPEDILKSVVQQYKYLYPENVEFIDQIGIKRNFDYKDLLDVYFRVAFMLRERDTFTSASEFFGSYGVQI
jgi:hypothetical protein